jgi:phosphopantothenoylcysteine decarboxylase/phosphopantothenate--cysteine ligase
VKVLITAGPTLEPIDAVRFISNRSSGKMGVALARAAAEQGHAVTLLLGPVGTVDLPQDVRVIRFETTDELQQHLEAQFPHCDVLIMAAAVADYRPRAVHAGKLPREEPGSPQVLELEPTPDLVAQCSARKQSQQRTVAFALEQSDQLISRAKDKLKRKGVDAIVANDLETMGTDRVTLHLQPAAGADHASGPMPKLEAAHWLMRHVARLCESSG